MHQCAFAPISGEMVRDRKNNSLGSCVASTGLQQLLFGVENNLGCDVRRPRPPL